MKMIISISIFMVSVAARAGYVGVMADTNTGAVIPAALESRISSGGGGGTNGTTGAVSSVNGQIGTVVLGASDVGAVPTNRTITINGVTTRLDSNATFTVTAGSGSGFPMTSNGSAAGYAITNASLIEASTGAFHTVVIDGNAPLTNEPIGSLAASWGNHADAGYARASDFYNEETAYYSVDQPVDLLGDNHYQESTNSCSDSIQPGGRIKAAFTNVDDYSYWGITLHLQTRASETDAWETVFSTNGPLQPSFVLDFAIPPETQSRTRLLYERESQITDYVVTSYLYWYSGTSLTASDVGAVPTNRTISINGATNELSSNVSFSVQAFPLSANADAANHALTNATLMQAATGRFTHVSGYGNGITNLWGGTVAEDTTFEKDVVLKGNFSVMGFSSNINFSYVDYRTNVYSGTHYIDTNVYTSINISLVTNVYETTITTQTVDTIVNVGGNIQAGGAAYVTLPTNTTIHGATVLTVSNVPAQSVTNVGAGLTGNGKDSALAVAWGQAGTNSLTNVNWGAFATGTPVYVEADTNALAKMALGHAAPSVASISDGTVALSFTNKLWRVSQGTAVATNFAFSGAVTTEFNWCAALIERGTNTFAFGGVATNVATPGISSTGVYWFWLGPGGAAVMVE